MANRFRENQEKRSDVMKRVTSLLSAFVWLGVLAGCGGGGSSTSASNGGNNGGGSNAAVRCLPVRNFCTSVTMSV